MMTDTELSYRRLLEQLQLQLSRQTIDYSDKKVKNHTRIERQEDAVKSI